MEENELAQQLKDLCHKNGRETDVKKTAKVLHKLGLVYKNRSPDRLCLLQSAVLLVGAKIRRPENSDQITKDLRQLCSEVLKLADAKHRNVDLMAAAEQFYNQVETYRKNLMPEVFEATLALKKYRTICGAEDTSSCKIMAVQEKVTVGYLKLLKNISDFCVHDVMGDPPCPFVLVGLGSPARNEVTTHSDFESMILLKDGVELNENYETILIYFRWYSVLIQLTLILFGEMVIPFAGIPSLNHPTMKENSWFYDSVCNCGISPDGYAPASSKNPLGNGIDFELIKPASKMLMYLETGEKNNLGDILTRTCYVAGDRQVYDCYANKLKSALEMQLKTLRFALSCHKEIKNCFMNYSPQASFVLFENLNRFDIKRYIYRSSTLLLMVLGRIYKVPECSSYSVVKKLYELGHLSKSARDKLQFAVAIACLARMYLYMKSGGQNDMILTNSFDHDLVCYELTEAVGEEGIVEYFCVVGCLQSILFFSVYSDLHVFDTLLPRFRQWMTPKAYMLLRRFDRAEAVLESPAKPILDHYILKQQLGGSQDILQAKRYTLQGACCFARGRFKAALKYLQLAVGIYKQQHMDDWRLKSAMCMNSIAHCHMQLKQFRQCHEAHLQAMSMRLLDKDRSIYAGRFDSLFSFGHCLIQLERYTNALKTLQRALEMRQKTAPDPKKDRYVALCFSAIGTCQCRLGKFSEALVYFEQVLEIYLMLTADASHDRKVADTHKVIAISHHHLQDYRRALNHFKRELEIRQNCLPGQNSSIAVCRLNIGQCLCQLGSSVEALGYLNEIVQFRLHLLEDCEEILALSLVAECYFQIGNYKNSLDLNEKLLDRWEKSKHIETHTSHLSCIKNVAATQFTLRKYDLASKTYLKLAGCHLYSTEKNCHEIASCLTCAVDCLIKRNKFLEALKWSKVNVEFRRTFLSEDKVGMANCLNNLAACYCSTNQLTEAVEYFQMEEAVRRLNAVVDFWALSECLRNIAYVLEVQEKYQEASQYYQNHAEVLLKHGGLSSADCFHVAHAFNDAGKCLRKSGSHYQAISCFVQALDAFQKLPKNDEVTISIVNCQSNIGECFLTAKMYEEALDHFQKMDEVHRLEKYRKSQLLRRLDRIARCYFALRRYSDAFQTYQKYSAITVQDNDEA